MLGWGEGVRWAPVLGVDSGRDGMPLDAPVLVQRQVPSFTEGLFFDAAQDDGSVIPGSDTADCRSSSVQAVDGCAYTSLNKVISLQVKMVAPFVTLW